MSKDEQYKLLDALITATSETSNWLQGQVRNGTIKTSLDISRINRLKSALDDFLDKFEIPK